MIQPSFYAIIPANVRYCKALEPSAKLLYGEITALSQIEGYCWATNDYFAQLYDVDVRTVKRWIASLAEQKFIKITSTKEGIKTLRKLWITPEIQKMFTKGQKCHGGGDKNVPHINTVNNTRKEPPIVPQRDEREACGAFVKLSKEEKEKAIELCGLEVFNEIVLEMNDYCQAHGKRYKDYAAAIRTWYRKRQKNPQKHTENTAQKAQNWAKEIKDKNPESREFEILPHAVRFSGRGNVGDIFIEYKDQSFYNRVAHEFKKRGWKIE